MEGKGHKMYLFLEQKCSILRSTLHWAVWYKIKRILITYNIKNGYRHGARDEDGHKVGLELRIELDLKLRMRLGMGAKYGALYEAGHGTEHKGWVLTWC